MFMLGGRGRGRGEGEESRAPEGPVAFGLNLELPNLALDGGGLRGTFAALLLEAIEHWLAMNVRNRPRPVHPLGQFFHLIAGTSTGAILAGALGAGVCAHELARIYLHFGPEIFRAKRFAFNLLPGRRLRRIPDGARYDPAVLERLLSETVHDIRLSALPYNTALTAYVLSSKGQRGPALFRGGPAYFSEPDILLREAIRASSAAPTFFPPVEITTPKGETIVAVDGGLFANNPAYITHVELRRLTERTAPGRPIPQVILSIGTGRDDRERSGELARWASAIDWMKPGGDLFLIDQMMHGQARMTDYFLAEAVPSVSVFRLDFELPKGPPDMTSAEWLPILQDAARRILFTGPRNANEASTARTLAQFLGVIERATPFAIV